MDISQRHSANFLQLGIRLSKLRARDAVGESALEVVRRPGRTLLTAFGTLLGVAAVVAIVGLAQSAQGAVSSSFNAELATQISFQESDQNASASILTENSENSLLRLRGVVHAGMISQVNGGQPLSVSRTPTAIGPDSEELPVTVATPGALSTMHAQVADGRLYDRGFESRGELVVLLGIPAAQELGISETDIGQAIFVNSVPLTIIGIVSRVVQQSQALLGLIVPPKVASSLSGSVGPPSIIVQTTEGAAQVVGREGPYALSPSDPSAIVAQVPPSSVMLRDQVEGSVSSLLLILGLVAFLIGTIAIANTTLLSVVQRTPEMGLRRALGATPRQIAVLVLIEAAMIGALGGILGASTGVLVTAVAAVVKGWTPVLSWQIVLSAPLLGVLAGICAGIYPSRRASRISPVSALQSG
jgi:putative ABC transport system permease protein